MPVRQTTIFLRTAKKAWHICIIQRENKTQMRQKMEEFEEVKKSE